MNSRKINELCRRFEDTRRIIPGSVNSYFGLCKLLGFCLLTVYISPLHGVLIALLLTTLNGLQFTDTYVQCTTAPTNFRENKHFDQSSFIQSVNKNKSSKVNLQNDGVCYGLMMMWYIYVCFDKENDFFSNLDSIIKSKNLNEEEQNLLYKIQLAQANQGKSFEARKGCETIHAKLVKHKSFDLDPKVFREDLNKIICQAIQFAVSNVGCLLDLCISWGKNDSHAIGLVGIQKNDYIEIKYFDPNFRIASCSDPFSAQKSIVNLIDYAYKYSQDTWFDKILLNINFHQYSVKSFSLDDCEWQPKWDGNHFFSVKNIFKLQKLLELEKQIGNKLAQREWDKRWGLVNS